MILHNLREVQKFVIENEYVEKLRPEFRPIFFKSKLEKEEDELYCKYSAFKELLNYYNKSTECSNSIKELKKIIETSNSLENQHIKDWLQKNQILGDYLFCFPIHYLDFIDSANYDIYLPSQNCYVERRPFLPIIKFAEIFSILNFGGYDLPIDKRKVPDPNEYYYSPPNPNEPTDIDKIINIFIME